MKIKRIPQIHKSTWITLIKADHPDLSQQIMLSLLGAELIRSQFCYRAAIHAGQPAYFHQRCWALLEIRGETTPCPLLEKEGGNFNVSVQR